MAIDCLNPPCYPDFPISSIVSVFGSSPTVTNSDCSTILLYLVDEEGLVDQSDAGSDPLLSTDNRTIQISNTSQVDLYFSPCSRLYWELKKFLSWDVGTLKRPKTITLGYFDSDNETMLEALESIYSCNKCFNVVSHITYDKNGTALFDTTDSVDLAEWATLNGTKFAVLPTVDYATTGAQLKDNGYTFSANVLLNDICIPELDANCEKTGNLVDTYDVTHLGLAAVLTSISDSSQNYAFTAKLTPKENAFPNLATTLVSDLATVRTITGVDPLAGGINPLANQYTNTYVSVNQEGQYWEGVTSTGKYIDEIIHQIYIKKSLERDSFELLNINNSVAISDLGILSNTITTAIRNIVSKGLISNTPNSINVNDVFNTTGLTEENVVAQGEGWVLMVYGTTQTNVDTRISPTFILCYVRPGSLHFVSLGLCQSNISEVQ